MGCNCKVNKEIMKIQKEYGHKIDVSWKERMKFKFEEGLKLIIASFFIILCFPLIFVFVIIFTIRGNGKINVNKVLRFILRKDE